MFTNDDYPCEPRPHLKPAYGHCAYDEDYRIEDEEGDQEDNSDDLDVLPFLSLIRGVPRPRFTHPDWDNDDKENDTDNSADVDEEDDEYDPDDYSEDDEDEEEEYDPDDYADYNDDDYDSDDDPPISASSPRVIIPLDDYLF